MADDYTVKIVTREPMADLLDLLSAMPISPKGALDKLPGEHVGSGPYRISKETAAITTLTAFKKYWGPAPVYKKIHWIAERDEAKRVAALLEGKADVVPGLSLEGRDRIKQDNRAIVHEIEKSLCIIFMCNARKGPCMDRRVRQALNHAVDVEAIIAEIKKKGAKPLNGYLTPMHFGYNPATQAYSYDPEKAKALLAEAGYKNGLKLVFDIPAIMPDEAPRLAGMMTEYLDQVGVQLDIAVHKDRAAYSDMVRAKNIHDACCFDSSPRSTYRVLREKLQSTLKGPWWQGYENKEVNALIKKAEATFDRSARQKIYHQIYTLVTGDAPWIFLYNPIGYHGVGLRMGDWKPRKDGLLIFK
jgi:peptide/nickel transport system substrate-binding protein